MAVTLAVVAYSCISIEASIIAVTPIVYILAAAVVIVAVHWPEHRKKQVWSIANVSVRTQKYF